MAPPDKLPFHVGIDRHFGLVDGVAIIWNPRHAREGEPEPAKKKVEAMGDRMVKCSHLQGRRSEDSITTDAFTDYAVDYLNEYRNERNVPVVCGYNSAALSDARQQEDVAKYRGPLCENRMGELRRRSIRAAAGNSASCHRTARFSPPTPVLPDWDEIPPRSRESLGFADGDYAAMIRRMDSQHRADIQNAARQRRTRRHRATLFSSPIYGRVRDPRRSTVKERCMESDELHDAKRVVGRPRPNTPYRKSRIDEFRRGDGTAPQ